MLLFHVGLLEKTKRYNLLPERTNELAISKLETDNIRCCLPSRFFFFPARSIKGNSRTDLYTLRY